MTVYSALGSRLPAFKTPFAVTSQFLKGSLYSDLKMPSQFYLFFNYKNQNCVCSFCFCLLLYYVFLRPLCQLTIVGSLSLLHSIIWYNKDVFNLSVINGHLGIICFWLFQIAYIRSPLHLYMPFEEHILTLSHCGYLPRNGNSSFVYIELCRQFPTVFQNDCLIFPPHQQCIGQFRLFHIVTNTWRFLFFFKLAILMSVQRYHISVLIFTSLILIKWSIISCIK